MKKKLLTLFMALVLAVTSTTTAFAADALSEPKEMADAIPTATGAEAIAALKDANSVVLDIRAKADYDQAHIKGSISSPVCKADFSVTTDERDAFVKFANENIGKDKKVYLVCYVGTFCVNFASKWLTDNGYAAENLYRVTGGVWNSADLGAACNNTAYTVALNDANGVILDVRATDVYYNNGYVDKSLHCPLFKDNNGGVTSGSDELATNFSAFVEANASYLEGKHIYLLCNGGASGAAAGTKLLNAAGYKTVPSNSGCDVFTIENGAKSDIKNSFIKNATIDAATAVKAISGTTAVVLDVRAKEVADKNPLKGAIQCPVFTVVDGANKVTSGYDKLAQDFLKFVKDNSAKFDGKDIYILCNSGASGAKAATKLLMQAGYSSKSDIFTITNGAKALEVRYLFLNTNQAVTGKEAVAALDKEDVVILDIRNDAKYDEGHLKGSIHIPVFNAENKPVDTKDDALAKEFITAVTGNKDLEGKKIYLLCNGGQRGARAATVLLTDAGYSVKDIYTITGGAGDADVKAAFIKEYNYIAGQNAVTNAKLPVSATTPVIIDVRATEVGNKNGTLDTSVYNVFRQPLFTVVDGANKVSNATDDQLALDFKAFLADNKSALEGRDIYILCNSGQSGARAATQLLLGAGYSNDKIFTITNGAKGLDVRYAFLGTSVKSVTSAEALEEHAKMVAGEAHDAVILDVRATGTYGSGHLKGVANVPVFTAEGAVPTADAELAKSFIEYVTANKADLEGKDLYLLCNSGQSGARAATVLLKDAGFDLSKVYTITGGYKLNADIQAAATYVSPERALSVAYYPELAENANIMIVDVRAAEKYEAGHLPGSLSLPLFDAENNLPEDLAEEFAAYVADNKADFEGKTIYILCNSGARGAAAATKLLAEAGITAVFTIEGGAKSELLQEYFVTDDENLPEGPAGDSDEDADKEDADKESSSTKTGDTTTVVPYVIVMCAALAAVIAISKRKLIK